MNLDLTNRRALVCGSTQGLGLASAVELANLGAHVTLLARDEAKLKEAVTNLPRKHGQTHTYLVADFAKLDDVKAAAGKVASLSPPPTILVNNTGGPPPGPAIDAGLEAYVAAFGAHLLANQVLTQAVVPAMKAAKFGRVINIISTSVKQVVPNLGVSNTIRGAVAQWAKTLAGELGPFGITVNNVLPGYTKTARLDALVGKAAATRNLSVDDVSAEMIATIPARRFGEAEDFAAAVAFLASPAASYINGINLPVDGGRLGGL